MLSQDGNGRRPSFCKRRKQSLTIVPSFSRAMWRTKRGRGRTAGRKWRSRGAGRARSGARGGFRARRTPLQRSLLNKEEEMFRNKLISQRRKLAVVQKQYEMLLKEKQKRSRKRKLEVDSKCVQAKSEGSSNVDGAQPSSSTEVPLISEKPYSVVRRVDPKPILNPIATGTSIRPSQSRRPKQKDPVRDAAKTKKPELCVFFTSTGISSMFSSLITLAWMIDCPSFLSFSHANLTNLKSIQASANVVRSVDTYTTEGK
mmetsp:Transcript_19157/g.31549  ORF Transcript_19157/g.31549 Transcript_19157/m.31549 type:complete len:258 (-) Transcript_19157:811-1584(-)